MTAAAGLSRLRMYDLRHHAITVLLENPDVSEEIAETIAGHISRNMRKRYSHVRLEAMRVALQRMQTSRHSAPPLRNRDVAEMLASGFSADVVTAKIKIGPCAFDVSIEAMKQLKGSGVPDAVILAMVKAG